MARARRARLLVPVVVCLTLLAGCSSDDAASEAASTPSAAAGCALNVIDPWVKATDTDMTAVFATISNPGAGAVTVTGATSPVAGMVQLHEVVTKDGASVMQPKAGGVQVPAGGTVTLSPGGDHIMLMELSAPIEAGSDVEVTLECAGGGTSRFVAVAKPFEGGAESYQPTAPGDASGSPTAS